MIDFLIEYRYPGIFLISLISNSIPFVGIPYLNFLVLLSPFLGFYESFVIAFFSAVGATLGKVVIYFIGRGISFTLSEKTKRNLEFFEKLFQRWGFFAVFFFAASPLPDDVLYIPLGIARYRILHYFLAVLSGKVVVTTYVIFAGKFASFVMGEIFHDTVLTFAIFFIATTIFTVIILKIDWKEVFDKYYRS